MAILAVARHVPIEREEDDEIRWRRAAEAAVRLVVGLAPLGEPADAHRILIASPAKRTVHTARAFAMALNAPLEEDDAFGEDRSANDSEIVQGIKARETILRSPNHTVVIITHQLLVSAVFMKISQWLCPTSGGIHPPNLKFGVCATNLATGELFIFGQAQSTY